MNENTVDLFAMPVATREDYLTFRRAWKWHYRGLSCEISRLKIVRSMDAQDGACVRHTQAELRAARALASRMMERLAEVKAIARAAYAASLDRAA